MQQQNEATALQKQLQSITEKMSLMEEEFNSFKDNIKVVKDGWLVIAYSGPETKERMLEFIKKQFQKTCRKCRANIIEYAQFCPECGTNQKE